MSFKAFSFQQGKFESHKFIKLRNLWIAAFVNLSEPTQIASQKFQTFLHYTTTDTTFTKSAKGYFENSWRITARRIRRFRLLGKVDLVVQIVRAKKIEVTSLSRDEIVRSPGASFAESVVTSEELWLALAAGTTSRRNRRWPRAWHLGPSDNPADRRWELEESELRMEGGLCRTVKRERGESWWGMYDSSWKGWINIIPICSIEE